MAEIALNELPPDLRRLHTKGVEAAQHDNFDYAINLFSQVLDKAPGCHECRRALRTVQLRKAGVSGGFFKKAFNFAGASPQIAKAQMALRRNPLEAIQIAEQVLNGDPRNATAHRILAEAAQAAALPRTAVLSYEALLNDSPDDKDLGAQFANALAETGEIDRAEEIMHELCRAHPLDGELSKALKNISARKTLGEGGYETLGDAGGTYRDIIRNKDQAVSLEQEHRVEKTEDVAARLIGEYETRLQTEPKNLKLIRSLAELYTQKGQYDRALDYYRQIKESEGGNDPSLDRAIATTTARKYDHTAAALDPALPDHAEQTARINADKLAYLINECQHRVERYPTDLAIRFEMGLLYFEAGRITEAIQEFQKAQANPHRRIGSLNMLAQCFARRGMNDSAVRMLQNALREKQVFDDEKKELTYQLGCVFEQMGKKQEAVEQFTIIYENDIGYKDVSARVDAFYAGQ